jgi:hypothetical protein
VIGGFLIRLAHFIFALIKSSLILIVNGIVLLRDNKGFSVIGGGTTRIWMYDGIVRKLEVQHVLKMKKNLIYLSLLDFQGYNYFAKDRILMICKSAFIMMKRKLVNDLYHLQGLIIIDSISVSYVVNSYSAFTHL